MGNAVVDNQAAEEQKMHECPWCHYKARHDDEMFYQRAGTKDEEEGPYLCYLCYAEDKGIIIIEEGEPPRTSTLSSEAISEIEKHNVRYKTSKELVS